jgi:hypothetical protein
VLIDRSTQVDSKIEIARLAGKPERWPEIALLFFLLENFCTRTFLGYIHSHRQLSCRASRPSKSWSADPRKTFGLRDIRLSKFCRLLASRLLLFGKSKCVRTNERSQSRSPCLPPIRLRHLGDFHMASMSPSRSLESPAGLLGTICLLPEDSPFVDGRAATCSRAPKLPPRHAFPPG